MESLRATLADTLSPATDVRTQAAARLDAWAASSPEYYVHLAQVAVEPATDRYVRLQAAVQLKVAVTQHWRRAHLPPPIKEAIRTILLDDLHDQEPLLVASLALTLANIARIDYPLDWPQLHFHLLHALTTAHAHPDPTQRVLLLHPSLVFLHHTVKALSSNRILKGQLILHTFHQAAFPTMWGLYQVLVQQAYECRGHGEFRLAFLAFKTLGKLFLGGWGGKRPLDADEVAFFQSTLPTLTALLDLRASLIASSPPASADDPHPLLEILTKYIHAHSKLYKALITKSSPTFANSPEGKGIVGIYWSLLQSAASPPSSQIASRDNAAYPTKLVVSALLILNSTLASWASQSSFEMSNEFVGGFFDLLLRRLLPLREEDLEQFREEEESGELGAEEEERWEFDLRPCVEVVLNNLFLANKELLGPQLALLLREASANQSLEGLLLKEAVYTTFCKSCEELSEYIDFERWLDECLIPEGHGVDPTFIILRRRIAQLLGSWISSSLTPSVSARPPDAAAASIRSKIYSLLLHLLTPSPSTNLQVQLLAARSIGKCDTWDFESRSFVAVLPGCMEGLVRLMGIVSGSEGGEVMRLNATLGTVVDRVGLEITPYAEELVKILSNLWAHTEENLFQTSILVTLTKLVEALGERSEALHSHASPIIALSVNPAHPAHVFLQEDALELWQSLLKRAHSLSLEMLELAPWVDSLLGEGRDVLPRVLRIMESYTMLDRDGAVLRNRALPLFQSFELLLGGQGLKDKSLRQILHAMNMLFQSSSVQLWAEALEGSGTFHKMLGCALGGGDVSAQIQVKYLCTTARIVLAGPETFVLLVDATARRDAGGSATGDGAALMGLLIDAWVDRLDYTPLAGQRKLIALALGYLVVTTRSTVLERLPEMVSLWSGVLAETEEDQEGDAALYGTTADYDSDQEFDYQETAETSRRAHVISSDPIHSTKLREFLATQIGKTMELNGGEQAFRARWFAGVETALLEELEQRLQGTLKG